MENWHLFLEELVFLRRAAEGVGKELGRIAEALKRNNAQPTKLQIEEYLRSVVQESLGGER